MKYGRFVSIGKDEDISKDPIMMEAALRMIDNQIKNVEIEVSLMYVIFAWVIVIYLPDLCDMDK